MTTPSIPNPPKEGLVHQSRSAFQLLFSKENSLAGFRTRQHFRFFCATAQSVGLAIPGIYVFFTSANAPLGLLPLSISLIVLFYPYNPKLFCPHCEKLLETRSWTCGHCDYQSYTWVHYLGSIGHKCSSCGMRPQGVQCYHCGFVIGRAKNCAVIRPIAKADKAVQYKMSLEEEWDMLKVRLEHNVSRFKELAAFQHEQIARLEEAVKLGTITEDDFELFKSNLEDFIIMRREI